MEFDCITGGEGVNFGEVGPKAPRGCRVVIGREEIRGDFIEQPLLLSSYVGP